MHRQWDTTENVANGDFSYRSEKQTSLYLPFNIIAEAICLVAQNIKEPDSSRPGYSHWQWRCTLISAQYTIYESHLWDSFLYPVEMRGPVMVPCAVTPGVCIWGSDVRARLGLKAQGLGSASRGSGLSSVKPEPL